LVNLKRGAGLIPKPAAEAGTYVAAGQERALLRYVKKLGTLEHERCDSDTGGDRTENGNRVFVKGRW